MRGLSFLLIPLAGFAGLASSSRPAEACGAPQCWPGAFVPGDGTTIPSNAPGLYWRPAHGVGVTSSPASVRLTTSAAPSTVLVFTATAQLNGDYVIVPDAPLVEGTSYVLEDLATCNGVAGPRVTFTAGPSAPLPTSLGTVTSDPHSRRAELDVATAAGSCSTTVDAEQFGIELAPNSGAAPWMALFLFETVVDTRPWAIQARINVATPPGASWQGRGRDLLFRVCTPNPDASYVGLAPAGHAVAFQASLPGALANPPLSTPAFDVELMCDSAPDPADGSAGCAAAQPSSAGLLLLALFLVRRRR